MKYIGISIALLILLTGCNDSGKKLPYLGNPEITEKDTLYPVVRDFSFTNQDSITITRSTFDNKIYIADFIFLSCPTICPKMTSELSRVYDKYKENPNILFLSHTIDPERDSVSRLREYTQKKGFDSTKWFFVTGERDSIYGIAEESYYTTAYADSSEPGGYVHGGGLLLVDKNKHIRGVYDGTDPEETERLIKDVNRLLQEQFGK